MLSTVEFITDSSLYIMDFEFGDATFHRSILRQWQFVLMCQDDVPRSDSEMRDIIHFLHNCTTTTFGTGTFLPGWLDSRVLLIGR
jgi:hypothetical protein